MSERTSQQSFLATSALLFVGSAALTAVWCASMSKMGGMPMPGGWTMSMMWMRMPEQSWAGAAASFVGMWVVMMAAMMMPSLAPALWHYREGMRKTGAVRLARLTALAAFGYFLVWTVIGAAAFVLGVALAGAEMESLALARNAPVAAGVVVLIAGMLQFTTWKTHHLACWRRAQMHDCTVAANAHTAWRYGLRLGIRCSLGCAGLTAVLLAVGVMDLRAMALVTAAITAERLAPAAERAAQAIGALVVGTGLLLIAHAAGLR